ncbi:hypothetical protein [Nitratireductor sp. GCM10026969]|uniref:hypothetical protein n=1 Tax=Nitratireductor sp. GCM10026969 TaxID=3252645 RepID=UPI003622CAE4
MIPAWLAAYGAKAIAVLGKILTFGITLPLWAFLAAGAWFHFDKSSAVREAVDNAVTELVAAEELAAASAEVAALSAIADERERRLAAAQRANRLYAERLAETVQEKQELSHEIDDILARPVAGDCSVDRNVLERLRNR